MFEVLFENEDLLVINKSADVSVLADRGGGECLWDRLKDIYSNPCLVHRLDKPTSGVMAVAKNVETQSTLTRAFTRREVGKTYVARVVGDLRLDGTGTIDLPLRPGRKNRYRVAGQRADILRNGDTWSLGHSSGGHPSLTRCRLGPNGLVVLKPVTGRTHQLRVHLGWIGHPIVGDTRYGKPGSDEQTAPRLMLHAHKLTLPEFGAFCAPLGGTFR